MTTVAEGARPTWIKDTWLASYILRLYNEVVARAKLAQGLE